MWTLSIQYQLIFFIKQRLQVFHACSVSFINLSITCKCICQALMEAEDPKSLSVMLKGLDLIWLEKLFTSDSFVFLDSHSRSLVPRLLLLNHTPHSAVSLSTETLLMTQSYIKSSKFSIFSDRRLMVDGGGRRSKQKLGSDILDSECLRKQRKNLPIH